MLINIGRLHCSWALSLPCRTRTRLDRAFRIHGVCTRDDKQDFMVSEVIQRTNIRKTIFQITKVVAAACRRQCSAGVYKTDAPLPTNTIPHQAQHPSISFHSFAVLKTFVLVDSQSLILIFLLFLSHTSTSLFTDDASYLPLSAPCIPPLLRPRCPKRHSRQIEDEIPDPSFRISRSNGAPNHSPNHSPDHSPNHSSNLPAHTSATILC